MSIRAIGIELEGGWATKPIGYRHDGSVSGIYANWVGETASPGKGLPPDQWEPWVRENYPQERNSSCGIHVHLSFTDKREYADLMNRCDDLEIQLVSNLREWGQDKAIIANHSFWSRIQGENTYCRKGSDPDVQAMDRHKSSSRYRILNFCYRLHGTLEVRVLPAFKSVDLAVSAIRLVQETITSFLAQKSLFSETLIKRRTIPTSLGPIEVKPWKQGVTCSLIAGPEVKKQALDFFYSWAGRDSKRELAYRLLTRTNVVCPMSTDARLSDLIDRAAARFNQAIVIIRIEEAV